MNTKISKKDPRDVFPVYSRSKYHSTAKRIRRALNDKQNPSDDDIDIVENWRASHRHILNVWQVILRKRATAEQSFMSCMYKKNSARKNAEFYNSQTVRIQEAGASAFFAALLTREARRDFFLSALFLWNVPDLTALSRAAY